MKVPALSDDVLQTVTQIAADEFLGEQYLLCTNKRHLFTLNLVTGQHYIIAGNNDSTNYQDGKGTSAVFERIEAFVQLSLPVYKVIMADTPQNRIHWVDRNSNVSLTLAGNGTFGDADGPALSSTLYHPNRLLLDKERIQIYITSEDNEMHNLKLRLLILKGNESYIHTLKTFQGRRTPWGMCLSDTFNTLYIHIFATLMALDVNSSDVQQISDTEFKNSSIGSGTYLNTHPVIMYADSEIICLPKKRFLIFHGDISLFGPEERQTKEKDLIKCSVCGNATSQIVALWNTSVVIMKSDAGLQTFTSKF